MESQAVFQAETQTKKFLLILLSPDTPVKIAFSRYMCELCGSKYQSNRQLKVHTFEKHELEATKCPVCRDEFPSREGATAHVRDKHWKPRTWEPRKTEMCEQGGDSIEKNLAGVLA